MPKKQPKNAFFFFMLEHVEREKKRGRHVSMAIAQAEVGHLWQAMTKEERAPYAEQAGLSKMNGSAVVEKYTSDGRSVNALVAEQKKKEQRVKTMIAEIEETVNSLTPNEDLETQYFYLIHTNYFTETMAGVPVPAEIAALQFCLQDGECATFHRILQPLEIPSGYRFECMEHSEQTHKIPVPPYTHDRRIFAEPINELSAFDAFLHFLEEVQGSKEIPILYASRDNLEITRKIFQHWILKSNLELPEFKIYEVERLLYQLKLKCAEGDLKSAFPTVTSAIEEIQRDVNCYASNISCQFHTQHEMCVDRFHYCSLSYVRRFMYVICDHCCPLLQIELIPGGHIHAKVDSSGATAYSLSKQTSGFTSRDSYVSDDDSDDFQVTNPRRKARRGLGRGCQFRD